MKHRVATEIGGLEFSIEMGKVATQADGAAYVSYGDTVVLATACALKEPREGIDFFLSRWIIARTRMRPARSPAVSSNAKGGPPRRRFLLHGSSTGLCARCFPKGFSNEVQVIALVLSADKENDPDVMSITGASAALYCSPIPFTTPIAGVRVGLMDGQFVANPPFTKLKDSSLNLIVAGSEDAIVMVEAGAHQIAEDTMIEALISPTKTSVN